MFFNFSADRFNISVIFCKLFGVLMKNYVLILSLCFLTIGLRAVDQHIQVDQSVQVKQYQKINYTKASCQIVGAAIGTCVGLIFGCTSIMAVGGPKLGKVVVGCGNTLGLCLMVAGPIYGLKKGEAFYDKYFAPKEILEETPVLDTGL